MKNLILLLTILIITSCQEVKQFSKSENQESNKENLSKNELVEIEKNQSPLHENLSQDFNYQSFIERIPMDYFDSCIIKVVVGRKGDQFVFYQANFTSTYLLGKETFENANVRSYRTGLNANKEVIDNDFGDIIVADFNFDNLEDFAVKREEGGNAGPRYNFYIQSKQSKFVLDKFLSDTIIWFPNEINEKQKTLQTLVRASAVSVCERTYEYNRTQERWKEINKQFYGE